MSFTSGIANNYVHLADRLRKWLTNVDEVESTTYVGTGNGTMTGQALGASSVSETFTIVCTVAALNGGTFSVTGSVSGALPNATVGVAYVNAAINFTINDGTVDYIVGDTYTVVTFVSTITSPWTQLAWTAGNVDTGGMSLYLRGPGAAADKQVFINIRSDYSDSGNVYNWAITGAINYTSGLAWGQQTGEAYDTFLCLWKGGQIPYWFYANERRFIVVAKINTLYVSLYAGFFLPWATPTQYPFPLYIGASSPNSISYTSTDTKFRSCVDPGGDYVTANYTSGKVRSWDGTWQNLLNHHYGAGNDHPIGANAGNLGFTYPFSHRCGDILSISTDVYVWTQTGDENSYDGGMIDRLEATAQGERLLLPVYAMRAQEPAGYGAIDGIYFPCGRNLTPEQTATFGVRTFRAFSNVFRTSSNDFFMVEEN